MTQTGLAIGTPSFMPPEQINPKHNHLTRAVDVYGLGAVLFYLLTGRPPFCAETLHQVLQLVEQTEPSRPGIVNRQVNHDLDLICLKCLDKSPQQRYANAAALAEDLEHWLNHEPISVRDLTLWEYVGKKAKSSNIVGVFAVRKAVRDKERAEAILHFLCDQVLLAPLSKKPPDQRGSTTIRETIEGAEALFGKTFPESCLVEADLRSTFADIWYHLGENKKAIAQYERALAIKRSHYSPEAPEVLNCNRKLVLAYKADGRLRDILPLIEETFTACKLQFGPEHPKTLCAMEDLAEAYDAVGRFSEAIAFFDETVRLRKRKLGEDHPDTQASVSNFAELRDITDEYFNLNDVWPKQLPEKAILYAHLPRLQKALSAVQSRFGMDHVKTRRTMYHLAEVYLAVGEPHEALALLKKLHGIQMKRFGLRHEYALHVLRLLALAFQATAQPQKAITLLKNIDKIQQSNESFVDLCRGFLNTGRVAEFIRFLEDSRSRFSYYRAQRHIISICLDVSSFLMPEDGDTKVITILNTGLDFLVRYDWLAFSDYLQMVIGLFEKTGSLKKASAWKKLHNELSDRYYRELREDYCHGSEQRSEYEL